MSYLSSFLQSCQDCFLKQHLEILSVIWLEINVKIIKLGLLLCISPHRKWVAGRRDIEWYHDTLPGGWAGRVVALLGVFICLVQFADGSPE